MSLIEILMSLDQLYFNWRIC